MYKLNLYKNMEYRIYALIDPKDGKIKYIGQTKKSLQTRLSNHINSAFQLSRADYNCPRNCWIRNRINNFGEINIILLETTDTLEKCNILEQKYIKKYGRKITNEGILVNTTAGGDNTEHLAKYKTRDVRGKKVDQYTIEGNFVKSWDSIRDIEETLGYGNTHITACCRGTRNMANNFIWRYNGDSFDKYPVKDTRKHYYSMYNIKGEFIKSFENCVEISKEFPNLKSTSNITSVCKGNQLTFGGYVFRFDNDSFDKFPIPSIKCYKNNNFYKSYLSKKEISEDLNITVNTLNYYIGKYGKYKEYTFEYSKI